MVWEGGQCVGVRIKRVGLESVRSNTVAVLYVSVHDHSLNNPAPNDCKQLREAFMQESHVAQPTTLPGCRMACNGEFITHNPLQKKLEILVELPLLIQTGPYNVKPTAGGGPTPLVV